MYTSREYVPERLEECSWGQVVLRTCGARVLASGDADERAKHAPAQIAGLEGRRHGGEATIPDPSVALAGQCRGGYDIVQQQLLGASLS